MKSIGEGRLGYAQTSANTNYYNLAENLSELNARNEEITDRKGNVYGYWCKVTTVSSTNDILVLSSVPNTWKVRNAFRKFHFARDHMFREAGVTKREMGKYGRTIRPYFNKTHITDGSQGLRLWNSVGETGVTATGGEWTYTSLASAPTFTDSTNVEDVSIPMADSWKLTVLGTNDVQTTEADGTKTWNSVCMVQAYNADRMEQVPDATADTAVESPNNPLAALRAQSVISGEVTEIAEDQELEAPPYDVTPGNTNDSVRAVWDTRSVSGSYLTTDGDGGQVTVYPPSMVRKWGLYFFPAGLISLTSTANLSNGLMIEVLGKELCKDVA